MKHLRLGINIDHVATVRNVRGGHMPDPCRAAVLAIEAGADGITAHLREDRRHIRDEDIEAIRQAIGKPLNFEMAATEEMVAIAIRTKPYAACFVPEKRTERTTEGGLDVVGGHDSVKAASDKLKRAGIRVSLFIEPSRQAIDAAVSIGAPVVELHTGSWAEAFERGGSEGGAAEFSRLHQAAIYAAQCGIECHAGHGLTYETARIIAAIPQIQELNIGHFLIGEAIFISLPAAVANMRAAMNAGRGQA